MRIFFRVLIKTTRNNVSKQNVFETRNQSSKYIFLSYMDIDRFCEINFVFTRAQLSNVQLSKHI